MVTITRQLLGLGLLDIHTVAGTRNRLYIFFASFSMFKQDSRNNGLTCDRVKNSPIIFT